MLYLGLLSNKYSHTAPKSVPLSSTTCVCNKKAHFLAFSSDNVSIKYLYANNVSGICFLLIFLELKNNTKSYSLSLKICFLKSLNPGSFSFIGLKIS